MKEAVAVVAQKVANKSARRPSLEPCRGAPRALAARSDVAARACCEFLLHASRRAQARPRLIDGDERRDGREGELKARAEDRFRFDQNDDAAAKARLRMVSDWRPISTAPA